MSPATYPVVHAAKSDLERARCFVAVLPVGSGQEGGPKPRRLRVIVCSSQPTLGEDLSSIPKLHY